MHHCLHKQMPVAQMQTGSVQIAFGMRLQTRCGLTTKAISVTESKAIDYNIKLYPTWNTVYLLDVLHHWSTDLDILLDPAGTGAGIRDGVEGVGLPQVVREKINCLHLHFNIKLIIVFNGTDCAGDANWARAEWGVDGGRRGCNLSASLIMAVDRLLSPLAVELRILAAFEFLVSPSAAALRLPSLWVWLGRAQNQLR